MIKTGLHMAPKVCMVDGPAVFVAFLENTKTQQPKSLLKNLRDILAAGLSQCLVWYSMHTFGATGSPVLVMVVP